MYFIPISLTLTSLYWWENFTNNNLKEKSTSLSRMLDDLERNRTAVCACVSAWKMLLIPTLSILWMLIDYDIASLFQFSNHSGETDPCVDHTQISTINYSWVLAWLVNTSACLLTYFAAKSAGKALLQISSYALPIALTTPLCIALLLGGCGLWHADKCTFQALFSEYFFWKCYDADSLEDVFLDQFLYLAIFWWISQLVIGKRVLKSKLKMADSSRYT